MNLKFPKGIVWLVLCYVLALVVLTTLEVAGIVSPRAFAILVLASMITAAIAFSRVFKRAFLLRSPTEERPALSERKRWYVLSAALLWIMLAFWLTRGEPWIPRLVGAAVVIVFVAPVMLKRRS